MTLVLALRGKTTIWMLADRRLTAGRRIVCDDAMKLVRLESDDGNAIIGYAGLGATSAGTQPSNWMSGVLRGRQGTLEQLLGVLAEAGLNELPRHIRAGAFDHTAIVAALVNKVPAAYGLGVERSAVGNQYEKYYRRYQSPVGPIGNVPPFTVAGSGAAAVVSMGGGAFRPLLRMARAFERGQISADTVSDALAALSYKVHLTETTVGPRSIVLWIDKTGTGGQTCYTCTSRDGNCGGVPTISKGIDIQALLGLTIRMWFGDPAAMLSGQTLDVDADRVNEELRKLPSSPDDKLR